MNKMLHIYRLLIPEFLRDKMYHQRLKWRTKRLKKHNIQKEVLNYIKSLNSSDLEILEIEKFLSNYPIKAIPLDIKPEKDFEVKKEDGMYYVDFYGKKMFFPIGTTKKSIILYCKGIIEEQNPISPHSYLSDRFNVNENSIIADIGAAEGNFALSVIDRVKKVYIFEADNVWFNALHKTFEPWKDKVEFIFSMVSDNNKNGNISLDEYFKYKTPPNFLKLDVEGNENFVLKGAENIINLNDMKIAICTYHRYDDDKKFKTFFENKGYTTQFSNSYMLMFENGKDFKRPYLRRGVLRAEKHI